MVTELKMKRLEEKIDRIQDQIERLGTFCDYLEDKVYELESRLETNENVGESHE